MSRPRKLRQVCREPRISGFGPKRIDRIQNNPVMLSVDEYEVIRLIDYESLDQAQCAKQMNVARTTVQRIYDSARKKISTMLIEGRGILIEGGSYKLCDGNRQGLDCNKCIRKHQ